MQTLEYRTVDKTMWDDGPWLFEPDKRQWQDKDTGLPCLIVRNPVGALCGYVGVPPEHALHGKGYGDEIALPSDAIKDAVAADGLAEIYGEEIKAGRIRIESVINVHGGLTFASGCSDMGRESFARWFKDWDKCKEEAMKHPFGDAAEHIAEWADCRNDYEKWRERRECMTVCHKVEPGECDTIWWFGFDCAHAFDLSPKMNAVRSVSGLPRRSVPRDVYRDFAYVTTECESLAKQLVALGKIARTPHWSERQIDL